MLVLLGCTGQPESALDPLAIVREVREHPDRGFSPCEKAGDWAGQCRVGWARVRLGDPEATREEILPACGSDEECLFDVLDARPHPDFLVQLGLCHQHLPETAPFCQQHAANRWLRSKPSEDERLKVVEAEGHEEARAKALGHLVACEQRGSCEGLHEGCELVVAMLAVDSSLCEVGVQ